MDLNNSGPPIVADLRMAAVVDAQLAETERQLLFWRERLQVAGSSCRSGMMRDEARKHIHALEAEIARLQLQTPSVRMLPTRADSPGRRGE